MLTIKSIIETINEPIVKIRGFTVNNEYFEIRYKNNYLDVRLSKEELGKMKSIFREQVNRNKRDKINIQYIIDYLGILFESGGI